MHVHNLSFELRHLDNIFVRPFIQTNQVVILNKIVDFHQSFYERVHFSAAGRSGLNLALLAQLLETL